MPPGTHAWVTPWPSVRVVPGSRCGDGSASAALGLGTAVAGASEAVARGGSSVGVAAARGPSARANGERQDEARDSANRGGSTHHRLYGRL